MEILTKKGGEHYSIFIFTLASTIAQYLSLCFPNYISFKLTMLLRYPYPPDHLNLDWTNQTERCMCFLLLDSSKPAVRQLSHSFAKAFVRQMELILQGKAILFALK